MFGRMIIAKVPAMLGTATLLASCGDGSVDPENISGFLDRATAYAGAEHGEPAESYPKLVDLLDEVEGWALGVKGGKDGEVYVVTNNNDSGNRSLRRL